MRCGWRLTWCRRVKPPSKVIQPLPSKVGRRIFIKDKQIRRRHQNRIIIQMRYFDL
jgi:hypothetical protein